jgi:DNA-binding Lrp family transcriptional regulator
MAMADDMDEIDRKILNLLQTDFPVTEEPFKVVGERIGIGENEVLQRVQDLKDRGIIRRIGAVFDLRKLGYVSTLCAARVPEDRMAAFVETVNAYPGVTHHYRRSHEYNVWFTFIAPSEEDLARALGEIKEKTGIDDVLTMKSVKTFKINATFEV